MKKIATGIAAAAAVFTFAGTADAQTAPTTPFSVEVRGGITLPTGDFSDDGAESGYDFGGNVSFGFMPNAAAYAGYTFNNFGSDDEVVDTDVDVEIKGFNGGVRFGIPVGMAGLAPYVKGGAVYYDAEISDTDLDLDSEWGFEVGGGVAVPLGMRGAITPEVRYTDVGGDIDVNFVTVDVGLRFRI